MSQQLASTTLLFYSPPYNGSDFFGHLVEHCINQNREHNYDHYFTFQQPVDIQYSHNFFSKTIIPGYLDFQQVIQQFQKPIQNQVITREIKVLRNELSGKRDQEELLADHVSTYIGYPMQSKTLTRVNYEKLKKYHEQYYINGHWLLINDNNTILATNIMKWYDGPVKYSKQHFIYREFRPKGFKYLTLIVSIKNPYDAIFAEFLNTLIEYREVYNLRYQEGNYYWRDYDSSYVLGHMYIGISHRNNYLFDEEFFETAKRYFLDKERLTHGKYMIRIWEILQHQRLDDQIVWDFINTINYDEVREVLQKLHSCDMRAYITSR